MRKTILFLLIATIAASAFSQSRNELIPRELFFKEKNKFNVKLSVDGGYIYYQKIADGADSCLYYVNKTSPSGEFRRKFKGQLVKWMSTYQSGLLLLLKEGNSQSVYYTSPLASSERKLNLMPFTDIEFIMQNPMVPNKVLLAVDAVKKEESGYYLFDLFNENRKYLGAKTEREKVLFDDNFFRVALFQTDKNGNDNIHRHSVMGLSDDHFTEDSSTTVKPMPVRLLSRSPEALFLLEEKPDGKTVLFSVNLKTGERIEMATDLPEAISKDEFSIEATGKPIAIHFTTNTERKRLLLDVTFKADFEFLDKELGFPYVLIHAMHDNKEWLIQSKDVEPIKYYYLDREKGKLSFLFNDYNYLDGQILASSRSHCIKASDGNDLPLQIYARKDLLNNNGTAKLPMPAIVYFHGEPWKNDNALSWNTIRHFELLANRGYVVIVAKLSDIALTRSKNGESIWNEKIAADAVEIANWAVKSGTGLRRRIGLMGTGYGAFAANYSLLKSPDIFSLAVSVNGISDPVTFSKTLIAIDSSYSKLTGDYKSEKAVNFLNSISPLKQAGLYKSQLLLSSGGLDHTIPPEQSQQFAKDLADHKKELIYFHYPTEAHDFQNEESWISFWAIAEYFLSKNLGGYKAARNADIELGDFQLVYGDEYVARIE